MGDGRIAQVEVIIFKVTNGEPLFLLLKRAPDRGGFWQPVTGGIEKGEDFKESALREMEEETGISEPIKILENIHYFEFEPNGGHGWAKEYVFGIQVSEDAEAVISPEHTHQKWCTLNEALDLLKYETNKVGFRKIGEICG